MWRSPASEPAGRTSSRAARRTVTPSAEGDRQSQLTSMALPGRGVEVWHQTVHPGGRTYPRRIDKSQRPTRLGHGFDAALIRRFPRCRGGGLQRGAGMGSPDNPSPLDGRARNDERTPYDANRASTAIGKPHKTARKTSQRELKSGIVGAIKTASVGSFGSIQQAAILSEGNFSNTFCHASVVVGSSRNDNRWP